MLEPSRVSISAIMNTFLRAYHSRHDDPKIFDDFLAYPFLTEEEYTFLHKGMAQALGFFDPELAAGCPDEASATRLGLRVQTGPVVLSRAHYTEEKLKAAVKQGVKQYVILGAGIDTFAFREPELVNRLQVFEVDHPLTQTFKRERIVRRGWELPPQLHFVPMDFTKDSLSEALVQAGYDPHAPSFYSWQGVTYYLTRDVIFDTLRTIAAIAPAGSALIFDYIDPDAFNPERSSRIMQRTIEIVQNIGEPMKTVFDPATLAADLAPAGWQLQENLSPADIEARYFAGRTDGFHAFPHFHYADAVVA